MVIPCSTKIKEGSWFVKFVQNNKEQIAVLSQARVIDYRRLHNKIGTLDKVDFHRVKSQFLDLLE
jgi:hypothetical protein